MFLLCCAIFCHVILCYDYVIFCRAMSRNVMLCYAILCHAILCCIMLCYVCLSVSGCVCLALSHSSLLFQACDRSTTQDSKPPNNTSLHLSKVPNNSPLLRHVVYIYIYIYI